MKRLLLLIIMWWSLVPLQALAQTYTIDPSNTTIEFKVRNLLITHVKGTFGRFKGTVFIDEADVSKSKVDVSIDTASIDTGINTRDNHLRSADFFDVAKFPVMTFVSTGVEPGAGRLKVTGDLTIKGVTRPVTLTVDGPKSLPGGVKKTASATANVDRQDFGVSWGATISDDVVISVSMELIKQEK